MLKKILFTAVIATLAIFNVSEASAQQFINEGEKLIYEVAGTTYTQCYSDIDVTGYKDIYLRGYIVLGNTATFQLVFNNDTTSGQYNNRWSVNSGSLTGNSSQNSIQPSTTTATSFLNVDLHIRNSGDYKFVTGDIQYNTASATVEVYSSWYSVSDITEIDICTQSGSSHLGSVTQGTKFYVTGSIHDELEIEAGAGGDTNNYFDPDQATRDNIFRAFLLFLIVMFGITFYFSSKYKK